MWDNDPLSVNKRAHGWSAQAVAGSTTPGYCCTALELNLAEATRCMNVTAPKPFITTCTMPSHFKMAKRQQRYCLI
jgi:hypothetical protein